MEWGNIKAARAAFFVLFYELNGTEKRMKPQDIDKKHPNTSRNCTKLKAYVKELTRAYAIVYTSVVNKGVFT